MRTRLIMSPCVRSSAHAGPGRVGGGATGAAGVAAFGQRAVAGGRWRQGRAAGRQGGVAGQSGHADRGAARAAGQLRRHGPAARRPSASWAALNPRHALAETTNAFPGKDNRGCDTVRAPHRKGTCLVVTVAPRRPRIEFRAADPALTPNGGSASMAEPCRLLDVIDTIERHVGPIKARRRGAGAGELLVGLAECMLAGGDFFTDLDPMRADVAGAQLRAVAEPPASTTAVGLGRRFGPDQLAGLRAAQAELIDHQVAALPRERRRDLLAVRPTIDLDPTDVEVYGEGKERIGWSYAGVRAGRPVPLVWAESGLVLTGTLLAGAQDVRPPAPALIAVAIEAWFRDRAWVEERIKDSKLGMALRHLPSGYAAANEVWMWAAFLALSLSAALQALTGHDQPHRAHGKRLRRELITVPARVVHHARRLIVRLAPGQADGPLTTGYDLLRALPGPAG